MSLKNLLDLRERPKPEIQIVEKIIIQKTSWAQELLKVCLIVTIVSIIVYGVSHADDSASTSTPAITDDSIITGSSTDFTSASTTPVTSDITNLLSDLIPSSTPSTTDTTTDQSTTTSSTTSIAPALDSADSTSTPTTSITSDITDLLSDLIPSSTPSTTDTTTDQSTTTSSSTIPQAPATLVVDDIGIYGTVTSVSGSTLSLDDSNGSQYQGINTFNVDLTNVAEVVLSDDNSITIPLSDVKAGDNITVQGSLNGINLRGKRIIYFSAVSPVVDQPTDSTSASTTPVTSTIIDLLSNLIPTSTPTTTDQSMTTSSSTPLVSTADSTSTPTTSVTSVITDLLSNLITPPPADSTSTPSNDPSTSPDNASSTP